MERPMDGHEMEFFMYVVHSFYQCSDVQPSIMQYVEDAQKVWNVFKPWRLDATKTERFLNQLNKGRIQKCQNRFYQG